MSIPAIFSEHGEAYFRQLETDLLKETSALGGFLVSCGGGAAMREENVREMKKAASSSCSLLFRKPSLKEWQTMKTARF